MVTSVLVLLTGISMAVAIVTFTMYAANRVILSTRTIERDRLRLALASARGFLYSVSTAQLPALSSSATQVLDEIDQLTKEA